MSQGALQSILTPYDARQPFVKLYEAFATTCMSVSVAAIAALSLGCSHSFCASCNHYF